MLRVFSCVLNGRGLMDTYIRNDYKYQIQKIIEWFIILGLFYFQFIPITNISIRFIVLLVVLLSCLFQRNFYQINNYRCFIVISVITTFLTFYHGLAVAKDFFIFCFGILSIAYFSNNFSFSSKLIYKYFLFVIIPLGFFNLLRYNNVFYFPFHTGHINIIGGETTKHGTAIIGTLLFVASGYNLFKQKESKSRIDIIFFIVGIYLVYFSGSRSSLLALIATIILYLINYNKYKRHITIIYFSVLVVLVFFMEYIQNYVYIIKNDWFLDIINAENFKRYGVTSGRAWLWDYHWDSFIDSPYFLGSGRSVTDFRVGDNIPSLRMRALAGCESPYTRILACYGLVGVFQLGILFYLTYKAMKKKNLLATCIIFICIYNTVMGVDLTNVLYANSILFYILYFSSFNKDTYIYNS